jgi:hypothetical protein
MRPELLDNLCLCFHQLATPPLKNRALLSLNFLFDTKNRSTSSVRCKGLLQ